MDGYAVIAADTAPATPIARFDSASSTGSTPASCRQPIGTGTCAEIATGAPLPDGADAVVMVEETTPAGDDHVDINAVAAAGPEHRPARRRYLAGRRRRPARRCVDAEPRRRAGRHRLRRRSRCSRGRASPCCPRATKSSSRELPLAAGQIYDVNRFTLAAVVAATAASPSRTGRRRTRWTRFLGARCAAPAPT